MSERLFHVSLFRHMRDTRPQRSAVTLHGLERILTTFQFRSDRDGPQWSPAKYRDGGRRRNSDVLSVSCLVADLDHGRPDLDAVAAAVRGCSHFLHSTWRHTPERPRLRLVVPLAEDIPADDYRSVWRRWAWHLSLHGIRLDPACSDISRAYYLPACQPDGRPFRQTVTDAPLFVWQALPAIPQRRRMIAAPASTETYVTAEDMLSRAIHRAAEGERNRTGFWLACQLRDSGLTQDEAAGYVLRYQQAVEECGREPYTEREALSSLRQAFRTPARQPWTVRRRRTVEEVAHA